MSESTNEQGVTISLAGRNVLVTGGSRGIGAATVRLMRQAGAHVAFSYNIAQDRAETLAAQLGGAPFCVPIQQELATSADGHSLVATAIQAIGPIDTLVVNHGVWPAKNVALAEMTEQQWQSTLAVNLNSVFGVLQAVISHILARDTCTPTRGHIVLVASTAAQRGEAFHADYAASKGALVSLTKSLSSELAPQGILVNCVAPGWIKTEMSAAVFEDGATSQHITSSIPLGRPGDVMEIAGPILFLCSSFAGFMSGEILNANGGAVLVG